MTLGAIAALASGLFLGNGAIAATYVTQSQAMDKLLSVDASCEQVALNYIPNSDCDTQTYVVEFTSDSAQTFVEAAETEAVQASLSLSSLSAFELNGFELANLARDPRVESISANTTFSISGTESPAPWQLDRLDQAALPLDNTYVFGDSSLGAGVTIYIVDTGINPSHTEFAGRLAPGYSSVGSDTSDTIDCNGHGTHVAGLAGGALYGPAKDATIVPVRVLDCDGNGSLLGVLMGLDWVATNTNVGQPAVVNMSLGGQQNTYLDNAIESLTGQGLAFVVAAGNSGADACSTSPARVPGAITVAASSKTDTWPTFSNYGSCVDIVAPGVELTSAWIGSSSALMGASGTSMAAGVVSGIVATQMTTGYQTPTALSDALKAEAVSGTITGVPAGTPNLLLQSTIAFTSGGTTTGGSQEGIDVPQDTTPISIVDPIPTTPTPTTPSVEVPSAYAKPLIQVIDSSVTVTWTIPEQTTPLLSQVLELYSGSTLIASYQLSSSAVSYLLTGLATGVVYKVAIAGVNLNGQGAFSESSDPFTLAGSVLAGPDGGDFSAWTKKISDTQVKFYSKFPQLGQKIQFMVQGADGKYKEIAWLRINADRIDESGEYIGLTNGVYFIRTINLKPGKNRLRIMVDGVILGSTRTYVL